MYSFDKFTSQALLHILQHVLLRGVAALVKLIIVLCGRPPMMLHNQFGIVVIFVVYFGYSSCIAHFGFWPDPLSRPRPSAVSGFHRARSMAEGVGTDVHR